KSRGFFLATRTARPQPAWRPRTCYRPGMSLPEDQLPGVAPQPPAAARGFVFNHSMLRVKDPAVALAFYTGVMGMRLLRKLDFPEMRFSLYFLARPEEGNAVPADDGERTTWTFSQRGVLELTHNWGTEAQDD